MKKQNSEIIIWRNGENLPGSQEAILAICHLSEKMSIKYDRLVGLALLMQSAVLGIKRENHPLYHQVTHSSTKLSEIAIGDTGNTQIADTVFDNQNNTFKMIVNPKNVLTLFTKDLHMDPGTKEAVIGFFMAQQMAKIRQEQRLPALRTADTLSTKVMREADSITAGLMTLYGFSNYPKALAFLHQNCFPSIPNSSDTLYAKTQFSKVAKDLTVKTLLALEKHYRSEGKTWLSYAPAPTKAMQYPEIYQSATARLAMILRHHTR